MTLVLLAGGEVGDLSEAEATSGTVAIESGIVRSGGFAYRLTPSGALASARFVGHGADGDFANLALSTIYNTVWIWFVTLPAADRAVFQLVDSSNNVMMSLNVDAAGVCTIDGSTTSASLGTVTTGEWNKFEIKGVQSGTCEGALNDGTIQTCTGFNFQCDRVILGAAAGSTSTHDAIYDDLLADDAEYPGTTLSMDNIKIAVMTADGVGANDQWNLAAGASKQTAVSVIPPNGDTTYIEEGTLTEVQDLTLVAASTIPIIEPILGIKATGIGRRFIGSGLDYGVGIKQSATYDRTDATFAPAGSYSMCAHLAEVDPVSAIAFTNSDLDSLQTSVERGATDPGSLIRVTQVLLHVAYAGVPPVPPTLPASEPEFTLLDNAEQIAREDSFVVIDQAARDQLRAVFVSSVVPVANVAISIVGGDCDHDPTQLPGLGLTWGQVAPPSGTSFIAYDIMRRVAGEADFIRIASITDITTLSYTDFCTTSRVTYEYSVRWRLTAGAAQVTSPDTDPPVFAQVEFDFLFIHLETDSSFFVRLDTYRADKRRLRDQRQLAVWGRERPTLAIGEQIWHQLRIPGLQQLLSERVGVWERLLDLMDQERTQASVLCVRFGRASERYFCNFLQETQRQAQKSYTPDITLVEVHFEEAV